MTHGTEKDALRLCCCHGHLDGLTLDEMSAVGAPCPTAAYVRDRMADAYDDGYDACVSDGTPQLHNGNPYRDDEDAVPPTPTWANEAERLRLERKYLDGMSE